MIFMSERVRRDQCLKIGRIDIIDECYFLIFEMNYQHIIEDIETGETVAG